MLKGPAASVAGPFVFVLLNTGYTLVGGINCRIATIRYII